MKICLFLRSALLIVLLLSSLQANESSATPTLKPEKTPFPKVVQIEGQNFIVVQTNKGPIYIKENTNSESPKYTFHEELPSHQPQNSSASPDYFSRGLSNFFDSSKHYGLGSFLAAVELSPKNMKLWSYLEKSYVKNKKDGMRDEDLELKLGSIRKRLTLYRLEKNLPTYMEKLSQEWEGFNSRLIIENLGYRLSIRNLKIKNIDILKGMPIQHLDLNHTDVSQLKALEGMPLVSLDIGNTPVKDISPIGLLPLEELTLSPHRIEFGFEELKKNSHLKSVGVQGKNKSWVVILKVAEFWKKVNANEFSEK